VAPADRLKIGKCNLRLSSDVTSKEATLQVVYDVLKFTPFYKAFQVTADAPEIYMQEFWATAYVHNRSVRFKMNNKKHILGLDQFRDILQICPKVGNKKFEDPPLEKEILAFLASLGHSGDIRKITDVNVNKLHQPWRSFAAIINKCLSGKPSYDSLRLSQAQILWDPSIPRRNKVNWHYARDDPMFTTINVISRNEDTQLYGTILPVALTNEDIRNSESYKEYYAIASGTIPPKIKGKAMMTEAEQLKIITKRSRKETHSSHASGSGADEGTGVTPGVPDAPDYDSEDDISWKSSDDDQDDEKVQDDEDDDVHDEDENAQADDDEEQTESEDDGDDFIHPKLTTHDDEIIHEEETDEDDSFDPTVHTPSQISSSDDEDSENEIEGTNVEGAKSDEDATYEEDQGNEAVEDTNTNLEGRDDVMTDVILPQVQATQEIEDTHVTLTPVNPDGQQQSSSVSSGFVSNMLNPNQDTGVDDIFEQQAEATSLTDIPVTTIVEPSFFANIRPPTPNPLVIQLQQPPILTPATTPKDNFSEFRQTNQYANALSSIPGIVDHYLANKMQEAIELLKPKTSHAVAANLSELELKKILIDKMEANNSINRSDIQRQLYKALVDAYEADKILLDTYARFGPPPPNQKRPRDSADVIEEPSAWNRRGQRRRSGKDPESTKCQEKSTTTTCSKRLILAPVHQEFETGVHDEQAEEESVPAVHESVQPWLSNLARRQDPRESFDELTDTTFDFLAFVMNRLNVTTLTPELLACLTFELMKGTCKSLTELEYFCEEVYKATTKKLDWINPEGRQYPHVLRKSLPLVLNSQGRHVIPFHHFINNDLEYLRGGESSRKYSTSVTKTKAADYEHIKWIEDLVSKSMWTHDVYSKRRIIAVTKVEIVEWENYKHLDWIIVRRDDDILYKFKEGDFHRLWIQDIEDMLLLMQGKLANLNVEERLAFNVSLRMFTRSVVIQRRVGDLQLGVESYQKKINLTKPDMYRSNLRRRDAYTPYSDPRGFIYGNKDKKNRLMLIDEPHKFSDGTLDDVQTALNDRLKGIRMEYPPQTFWSQRDQANARAMIQAIDKRLKTRRIMRSLEVPIASCHEPSVGIDPGCGGDRLGYVLRVVPVAGRLSLSVGGAATVPPFCADDETFSLPGFTLLLLQRGILTSYDALFVHWLKFRTYIELSPTSVVSELCWLWLSAFGGHRFAKSHLRVHAVSCFDADVLLILNALLALVLQLCFVAILSLAQVMRSFCLSGCLILKLRCCSALHEDHRNHHCTLSMLCVLLLLSGMESEEHYILDNKRDSLQVFFHFGSLEDYSVVFGDTPATISVMGQLSQGGVGPLLVSSEPLGVQCRYAILALALLVVFLECSFFVSVISDLCSVRSIAGCRSVVVLCCLVGPKCMEVGVGSHWMMKKIRGEKDDGRSDGIRDLRVDGDGITLIEVPTEPIIVLDCVCYEMELCVRIGGLSIGRALSPVRADLLSPRKRIRDIDADTAVAETTTALEVGIGIEANVGVEVGIGIEREDEVEEEAESGDRGTIDIKVDRVSDIEGAQRD
ncbi:hypothetical protein Tco_1578639, partial [Tanacetum coccineum]